jgi:hypothetical protein
MFIREIKCLKSDEVHAGAKATCQTDRGLTNPAICIENTDSGWATAVINQM